MRFSAAHLVVLNVQSHLVATFMFVIPNDHSTSRTQSFSSVSYLLTKT